MKRKKNPDDELRRLERLASQGDLEAEKSDSRSEAAWFPDIGSIISDLPSFREIMKELGIPIYYVNQDYKPTRLV